MKRAKIILTAVILLGTVGGVLAVKVKRKNIICTAAVPSGGCNLGTPCSTTVKGKITNSGGGSRCTAAPLASGSCPSICPVQASTATD